MSRRTLVIVASLALLALAILPALAASVDPVRVAGSSTCTSVGSTGDFSLTIEPVANGIYPGPGGVEIEIILDGKMPNTFGFIMEGGLAHDALVKGSASNHYDYAADEGGPTSSDSGLTIPNGNSLKHAIFCYDVTAEIAGTKVDDENASGGRDDGEPGVEGWEIFLLSPDGEGGFNVVDSASTGADGQYGFPDPGSGSYFVCEAADGPGEVNWQQSGPLGSDNDVCPDTVLDGGESFVDLAAGGYAVDYVSGTRVADLDFFNFDGEVELICDQDVSVGGEDSTGIFTRLPNDCEEGKTAQLRVDEEFGGEFEDDFEVIVFIPSGEVATDFRGVLTFIKQFDDPSLLVLQYDPDNDEVSTFVDVPACEDAVFDGSGMVESATIPEGDTWCFAEVVGQPIGDGFWQVAWQVFGTGDPRWK